MKLLARPKCLADATAPLLTVVRLLGLRAFEFRGRPKYIISLIYLLLLYIIYCCSLHVQHTYYSDVQMLKLESVLLKLMMYITSASILMKLLLGWWYTEKYKVCHQKITAIDETLGQLGLPVKYDKIYFTMVGLMVLLIILFWCGWIASFIVLQGHESLLNILYAITMFTYGLAIDFIIVLEFSIIVTCIRTKFKVINRFLWENLEASMSTEDTKLGPFEMNDYACIMKYERRTHAFIGNILTRHRQKPKSSIVSVVQEPHVVKSRVQSNLESPEEDRNQQPEECIAKIERQKCLLQIIKYEESAIYRLLLSKHAVKETTSVKQVHLELCKISKTLCTIFGVQIACEIGICIMVLTGLSYTVYIRYVLSKHTFIKHFREQIFASIIMSIIPVLKLILVSRACKTTADEGNKTIEIIHATYGCDADGDLSDEIQQFGIQIVQSPVAFTAVGLPLDNTILTMSLRSITTYLVIMIQVSNSLESNKAIQHAHL